MDIRAQLETALAEAEEFGLVVGEPASVQLKPLQVAQAIERIASLEDRNAELGRRHAAAADALGRVEKLIAGWRAETHSADLRDCAIMIHWTITEQQQPSNPSETGL